MTRFMLPTLLSDKSTPFLPVFTVLLLRTSSTSFCVKIYIYSCPVTFDYLCDIAQREHVQPLLVPLVDTSEKEKENYALLADCPICRACSFVAI